MLYRRPLFIFLLLALVLETKSQAIHLENISWGPAKSRIIYVGVENKFILKENSKLEIHFSSDDSRLSFSPDTLTIYPSYPGNVMVLAKGQFGTDTIRFQSTYLPPIDVVFQGENSEKMALKKSAISKIQKIALNGNVYDFGDKFVIEKYTLGVGDREYTGTGDTLTTEMKNAMAIADAGIEVKIVSLILRNPESGSLMHAEINRTFVLK